MTERPLFRQKSLDRISSPEELDGYIRVARPSTWVVLAALVVLLLGFVAWGILGTLETCVGVRATVTGGSAQLVVNDVHASRIEPGLEVELDGREVGRVSAASYGGSGETAEVTIGASSLPDGTYDLSIVVERVSPLSFVLN